MIEYYTESGSLYIDGVLSSEYLENAFPQKNTMKTASSWTTLSSSTQRISWAAGTAIAVVAGAMAIYLGSLGIAGVIAAMGIGTLGILANNCIGGVLYVKLQTISAAFTAPQYRYVWSFKASTNDYYGPYATTVLY